MKKFNHLNIPDHWQQYWTRYPEGYTILEALINWVSQVNDMVDSQNKLSEEYKTHQEYVDSVLKKYRNELDDFLRRFSFELRDEVEKVLQEWQNSGFLEVIISEALETKTKELNSNIHKLERWELNSRGRKNEAITVFRSDDIDIAEWNYALPIFSSYNVPQCIAAVSDWVGQPGRLSKEQLLELQNDHGWEILSHSKTHPTISGGSPAIIPDMTEEQVRYEYSQSKKDLQSMGLKVESYAHVGGLYSIRDRKLTREYYRSALVTKNGFYNGLNKPPIETHELKTIWLDPSSSPLRQYLLDYDKQTAIQKAVNDCYEAIDKTSEEGGILVIGTHFKEINDSDYQQMYSDVIHYSKQKTTVTTLSKALDRVGNIVEVGDYTLYSASNPAHTTVDGYFAIAPGGKTVGGLNLDNRYDGHSNWREFPLGETLTTVTSEVAQSTGLPEGIAGTMRTVKTTVMNLSGLNYQEFRPFRSDRVYYRVVESNNEFGNFIKRSNIEMQDFGVYDLNTKPSEFGEGITTSEIFGNATSQTPDGQAGLLFNVKVNDGQARQRMNYQLFHSNFRSKLSVWKRVALEGDTWSEFSNVSGRTTLPNEVPVLLFSDGIENYDMGVSYENITASYPDILEAPGQVAGLRKTVKVTQTGNWKFNYQEYHLNFASKLKVYKRVATSATAWSDWQLLQNAEWGD